MEKNVHLRYIQYLLGHTSPLTTARYTSIADIPKIELPELININGIDLFSEVRSK